jgi:hypothetical protein
LHLARESTSISSSGLRYLSRPASSSMLAPTAVKRTKTSPGGHHPIGVTLRYVDLRGQAPHLC